MFLYQYLLSFVFFLPVAVVVVIVATVAVVNPFRSRSLLPTAITDDLY